MGLAAITLVAAMVALAAPDPVAASSPSVLAQIEAAHQALFARVAPAVGRGPQHALLVDKGRHPVTAVVGDRRRRVTVDFPQTRQVDFTR